MEPLGSAVQVVLSIEAGAFLRPVAELAPDLQERLHRSGFCELLAAEKLRCSEASAGNGTLSPARHSCSRHRQTRLTECMFIEGGSRGQCQLASLVRLAPDYRKNLGPSYIRGVPADLYLNLRACIDAERKH